MKQVFHPGRKTCSLSHTRYVYEVRAKVRSPVLIKYLVWGIVHENWESMSLRQILLQNR